MHRRTSRAPAIPREVEQRFRGIIREELLHGVPDFALRRATDEYIEALQRAIIPHVRVTSRSPQETREGQARLKSALEQLGDEVQALLQDRLYQWVRKV